MNINMKVEEAVLNAAKLNSEGSRDNPTSRTDLTFEGVADKSVMAQLVGSSQIDQFWGSDGEVQLLGILAIQSKASIKDCTMTFQDYTIESVKARKFSFTPISGGLIHIKLQIQVHHTSEQLVIIDKWQKQISTLVVESRQGDLLE